MNSDVTPVRVPFTVMMVQVEELARIRSNYTSFKLAGGTYPGLRNAGKRCIYVGVSFFPRKNRNSVMRLEDGRTTTEGAGIGTTNRIS